MSAKAWPIGIIVGLGFVVVANAVMISIAISNPSAPAAKDHWVASQAWNEQLELRERSAKLGWSVTTIKRELGSNALVVHLADREGRPVEGLEGEVVVSRADTAAHDASAAFVELGGGQYRVALEVLPSGRVWLDLDVHDDAGQRFVSRETLDFDATRGGDS